MSEELVSILMSVYNEKKEWIQQSVESILNQSYKNIEFIIILDNPNNEEIRSQLVNYQEIDNRIKLFFNTKNIGLVNSLNNGLKLCSGNYVARMDADDISDLNRIQKQINYIKERKVEFVFSGVDSINEDGKTMYTDTNGGYFYSKCKKLLEITNCSFHPTWFVKKEVYEELNGYRHLNYCEDYDFSLRALKKGFKIEKMSDNLLKYRIRDNSVSRSHSLVQYLNMRGIVKLYRNDTIFDDDQLSLLGKKSFDNAVLPEKIKFDASEKAINYLNAKDKKVIENLNIIINNAITNKYFRQKMWTSFKFRLAKITRK